MPLRVVRRKSTGALTIVGTVRLADGSGRRVRARAQSDRLELAREEAVALEAQILRDGWHGERRGVRSFAEAVASYLKAAPRSAGDEARLDRILAVIGRLPLGQIDQGAIDLVRDKVLKPGASPATLRRGVIVPIRAVMRHAARRKWCDVPEFEIPREPKGRTNFLLPGEAERLVAAAAPHLQPLLVFLLGTGARLSEALDLEWRDVDLAGGRANFWPVRDRNERGGTKGGERRVAHLPPRVVVALARLGHRDGPVFRWETKRKTTGERAGQARRSAAYADRRREGGGQISSGWKGAIRRAGLNPELTPHDLRHSWASWHYALHRDLLALKLEGGWSSVALVERYAHLLPAGHETAIQAFWQIGTVLKRASEGE